MKQATNKSQDLRFRSNRTFICSVVFIDIVEYSKKSVNEQILIKEHFNALLSEAISDVSINDRIILDTGDGAAIGFLGDPEDALFVAMSFREDLEEDQGDAPSALQVRMGINLGPVKLLKDINNQPNLIGDGINVAQRIMNFAEPGQLLVSRSYYDIVSCLSQEYAKLFQYQGARADKHIREHDIYAVGHTGPGPLPVQSVLKKKPGSILIADDAVAEPERLPINDAAVVRPEPTKPGKSKKTLLFIGGAVTAATLALALVIFIPRGKAPVDGPKSVAEEKSASSKVAARDSKTEAPAVPVAKTASRKRAADTNTESKREAIRPVSTGADGILFTITGIKTSGNEITFIVRTLNGSNVEKSVALYDDAFGWTKSKITDGNGTKHDVKKVSFVKGSKAITMSAAGTVGILIAPHESVTTYLTFKRDGKGLKALNLHPFIYQGRRNWKEHELAMDLKT